MLFGVSVFGEKIPEGLRSPGPSGTWPPGKLLDLEVFCIKETVAN